MKNPYNEENANDTCGQKPWVPDPKLLAFRELEHAALNRLSQWAKEVAAAGRATHWDTNEAEGTDFAPGVKEELTAIATKLSAILMPAAQAAGKERDASVEGIVNQGERRLRDAAKWVWEDRVHKFSPDRKSPRWF